MIPVIDSGKCDGCEACTKVCPPGAVEMRDGKAAIVDALCEECGVCVDECPVAAIAIPERRK